MNEILLIMGPSGVGKSSVIDQLRLQHAELVAVPAYTTRPLRSADPYRISVTAAEFETIRQRERLLTENFIYGHQYGTSARLIQDALQNGHSVVVDCPVDRAIEYRSEFPNRVFGVYLISPSVDVLRQHLADAGRDPHSDRLRAAVDEIRLVETGHFDHSIDLLVVAYENQQRTVAIHIYNCWASAKAGARP